MSSYLMAGQLSELERLQLQSRVWEPAGERLLVKLKRENGRRAVDIGCGAMSWLRILSRWVGTEGEVLGTDIDATLLEAARGFVDAEKLGNVEVRRDDLFASQLEPNSFDLVHARFQLAPLGRAEEQITLYRRLVRPGGWLVLEEPDTSSWHFNPPAPAAQRLIALILEAFRAAGGNFDMGRELPALLGKHGLAPQIRAEVEALPPGHPYLRLPLQFARSLEQRLTKLLSGAELRELREQAEGELSTNDRWGLTFTLVQAFTEVGEMQ